MEKVNGNQSKLQEINKYYRDLKASDVNFRFRRTTAGLEVPDYEARKARLLQHSYLNQQLMALKSTDWADSPIYHQFRRNGYLKHEDSSIFSDIELKYLHSTIRGMAGQKCEEEFNETDGRKYV